MLCTEGFEKVQGLGKIDDFCFNEESANCVKTGDVILKNGNKYYMTWLDYIFGGFDIVEKDWVLVADNVKKFNGQSSSCSDALAYIDENDDLYVVGLNKDTIRFSGKERWGCNEF